ncbi:MAG: hypothetical protein WBF65_10780, partial [Sphingopyxis granuli]|uniref:hypothetical protein n=1 Tax=Sphingopyxis granuli TaxID=267128 RepID=UPI003C7761EC
MSLEFALGPIDIQLWRPANGGFSRFRCSRAVSTLRSESRKTTIFASPSSECRLVLEHQALNLTHRPVRVERSRDTHQRGARPMRVST